eukprot:CAMPEP_0113936504 /NCGR_PEP_ID=MMETSP1339-20121228/3406_1 /TAXON_ID=94617 /ORGANISM="Fibrocapsa japonica" /LENGTH=177 /DNA_ID=CAMNT_0000939007 /DNA_START=184 /DNA_END=714 /DNA_ORIENTATION=+ /assembly_acc=CAM_ASM_000762
MTWVGTTSLIRSLGWWVVSLLGTGMSMTLGGFMPAGWAKGLVAVGSRLCPPIGLLLACPPLLQVLARNVPFMEGTAPNMAIRIAISLAGGLRSNLAGLMVLIPAHFLGAVAGLTMVEALLAHPQPDLAYAPTTSASPALHHPPLPGGEEVQGADTGTEGLWAQVVFVEALVTAAFVV